MNDYWNMQRDYQPINDTTLYTFTVLSIAAKILIVLNFRTLNLQLTFQPLSLLRWQLYAAQSMRNKWTSGVFGDTFADEEDTDQDSLKEALLETSPYLLGLTFAISILHSIFELLAFKNGTELMRKKVSIAHIFFSDRHSVLEQQKVSGGTLRQISIFQCFPVNDCASVRAG